MQNLRTLLPLKKGNTVKLSREVIARAAKQSSITIKTENDVDVSLSDVRQKILE
jgi:hypothetical protein